METAQTRALIVFAGLVLLAGAGRISGSGGWYDEEPPHSLAGDLDRLPAKSLGQILLETEADPALEPKIVANEEILALIARIGAERPEAIAKQIDSLVLRARALAAESGGTLNALYDVRDAITASGQGDEDRKKYCGWRVTHEPNAETQAGPEEYAKGEPMRPHALYLEGAARFTEGDRKECRPWFEEIVKQYADHPRAETARFLLARCDLWAARYTEEQMDEAERNKRIAVAEASFRDYLKRYHEGRYAADAHGWLGGILWETHPAESLEHFITQLDDKSHPECAKSAAHMIERVLARVVAEPEGENLAVLKVVAQHPRVAQAAVYYVLNASETNPYDGKYDEPAALKQWRLKVLPRLAAGISREQARYQGVWAFRMRAMLAQAASAAGRQDEALKLTKASRDELAQSDDLLFARLVALQRSRQTKEAIDAGLLFLKTFEESPLRAAVPVRLAQALIDEHRAGEAYLSLCQTESHEVDRWHGGNDAIYPPGENDLELAQSAVYPDIDGTDAGEELRKSILNFAPIKELEGVLDLKEWDEKAEALGALKTMLAERKASNEDFAGAAKLNDDAEFQERMAVLGKLAKLTAKGDNRAKARAMMELGDAFEAAADKQEHAISYEPDRGDAKLALRENARALGFADPDQELENRSLRRHATRWWLRAARLVPATDISAKARFKVLDGIERIALDSEYDFTRAVESNIAQASRGIYNVLQKESPNSKEAREAVYWTFEPCPKPKDRESDEAFARYSGLRGGSDNDREVDKASLLGGYRALPYDAFGEFEPLRETDNDDNEVLSPFLMKLRQLPVNTPNLPRIFTKEFVDTAFQTTVAAAENAEQMKVVNLFEDLKLFYQVPEVTNDTRHEYFRLRLRADNYPMSARWENKPDLRPAFKDLVNLARETPALASLQDFVDYAELYANEADRGPGENFQPVYPKYKDVETGCRSFLKKYPESVRRPACSLLLIRAIYRQLPERFGHAEKEGGGVDESVVVESGEAFREGPLVQAIADYEKEFPSPRYGAEVRNFRGIIAWRKFDYRTALALTIAQLDDMNHLDLQREAAVRLANIFADLRDPKHREAVMTAVKSSPAAMEKLKDYLEVAPEHKDHPLRCLGGFLRDKLGPGLK